MDQNDVERTMALARALVARVSVQRGEPVPEIFFGRVVGLPPGIHVYPAAEIVGTLRREDRENGPSRYTVYAESRDALRNVEAWYFTELTRSNYRAVFGTPETWGGFRVVGDAGGMFQSADASVSVTITLDASGGATQHRIDVDPVSEEEDEDDRGPMENRSLGLPLFDAPKGYTFRIAGWGTSTTGPFSIAHASVDQVTDAGTVLEELGAQMRHAGWTCAYRSIEHDAAAAFYTAAGAGASRFATIAVVRFGERRFQMAVSAFAAPQA